MLYNKLIEYFYYIITLLLLPFYIILLIYRIAVGKEDIHRIFERFGRPHYKSFAQPLIWLHAASVGESLAAITIINAIKSYNTNYTFLITTGTLSSSEILAQKLPASCMHQFLPIDNIMFVRKFLKYWKPQLGIFIESELWPTLIIESAKNCKLLLLNAKLSDKSFVRWHKLNFFFKIIMKNFSEVLTQSEQDLKKFHLLGVSKAENFNNIKFANKKLEVNPIEKAKLQSTLQGKDIVTFASTHKEDEEVILPILSRLKTKFTNSYFILVLRHPERAKEVAIYCDSLGLKYSFRGQNKNQPNINDDLFIIDSFSELGLFYELSNITFIGGSFVHGGHNPLEATYFDNVIIFGPDMSNCISIASTMLAQNAAIQIKNAEELQEKLGYFLLSANKEIGQKYKDNAKNLIKSGDQVLTNYLDRIKQYL